MDQTPLTSNQPLLTAKFVALVSGVLLLVACIVSVAVINQRSFDFRKRAATNNGTVVVSLKPGTSQLSPSTSQVIELQTNTGDANVIGYELFIDFTGSVPANLVYTPTDPSGLSTATYFIDQTSTGKRLTIGLLAPVGNPKFSTANTTITLGKISFTAPATGDMTVSFDSQLSRSLLHTSDPNNTVQTDVLKVPERYVYTFGQNSTPLPTARPSVLPTPTPAVGGGKTPTPVPSVRPSPPPGCVYEIVQCVRPPCDPILVCSSPIPTAATVDDLFFAPETEANSIFWFKNAGNGAFVPSNQLVIGKTYSVEINPQVQNNVKTTATDNRNVVVGLRVNGSVVDTATILYSAVSNQTNGASFQLLANFVAKAQNTLEVLIDPYGSIKEANETNNTFVRTYAGIVSPTTTPIPSTPRPTSVPVTPRPTIIPVTPRPATPVPTGLPASVLVDSTCARVICQAQAGCTCPSNCNFQYVEYGRTCGGVKGGVATPVPGTNGNQEQWNRLPYWLRQLLQQFIGRR